MMKINRHLFAVVAPVFFFAGLFAQSGGPFAIQQSLITTGGGGASGGPFEVEASNAQPTAHPGTAGGPFGIRSGFWYPTFAPTAASASISGRVTTADGRGLQIAKVICVGVDGNSRSALTNGFGYYFLSDIPAGQTYIISVERKGYSFTPRVVNVVDDLVGVDFVPE